MRCVPPRSGILEKNVLGLLKKRHSTPEINFTPDVQHNTTVKSMAGPLSFLSRAGYRGGTSLIDKWEMAAPVAGGLWQHRWENYLYGSRGKKGDRQKAL